MKVVFATDYLPTYHDTWGGAEHACLRISQMLGKNGHKVGILSTKPDRIPEDCVHFLRTRVIEDFFPKKLKYTIRQFKSAFFPLDVMAFFSAYGTLRKLRPDVLHLHNIHSLSFSLAIVARMLKIPVVISIYDYGIICPIGFLWILKNFETYEGLNCAKFHGTHCIDCVTAQKANLKILFPLLKALLWFRAKLLDTLLKNIDGFIVLSESNADVLVDYGITRDKIGVVQIPMDEVPYSQKIEENSILFIGWLHPRKGPHVVVNAMPHVLKEIPTAKLYMFGDEKGNKPYKEGILNFIKNNHIEKNICLFGRVPHAEVREYLRKVAVIVIPETWETIAPNTLTEGLTYGKAVVASRVGGSKDYIVDGENGLLAENNNPADFAKKIVTLLQNNALADKLRKNAKKSWYEFFSEKKVNERLVGFYRTMFERTNGHSKELHAER